MKIDDITPWLAVWGALTGTIGLGWQIWTRRQAPNPNLKVELSMMGAKHRLFGQQGIVDAVLIHVTNKGPLSVKVVSAGFLSQDRDENRLNFVGYGVNLPQEVSPQRALNILIEFEGVRTAIALSKPARAWVLTDTGREFLSPRTQVIRLGTSGYEENLKATLR